ncbi:very short patch repair endonuclease [Elizabethkingia miricola]|uniref:very short patch repair endonuclease n=1 Tax=Elizabethkingia TaxID=308865 RepID=UPI000998F040|nr:MULTISPECIES: very short patch repair endonuclease [Elizabethkingia]MCL1653974.1 very short patch repair endonuclease [Elizabethkingia miricola]OPC70883.1 very short patch repair endonuclease [Elizabethkingia miricola]OPC74957.1 very short patch repair endonuclease [Elizabethkingia miricola]QCO48435.1 very short patch repair endonuclease [Elizabethkingia sp. 2-6]
MDVHTPEQRSKNMRAIKATGTKDEIRLAKALWHSGYRYRKNDKTVFGKPDLVLKKYKVAIFVDSEFFHGKDWNIEKFRIKSNQEFWHKKIERNIERDKEVNQYLTDNGWKIIRFWSTEVKKHLQDCIDKIISIIEK